MEYETVFALRMLDGSIRRHIDRAREKQEIDHVTGTHGWIICYLAEHENEDIYQRDLEKEFGICRSTASKLLALMEKNGLIERGRVASDDRLKKIVLTPRAKEYTGLILALNRRMEAELTQGFSAEELTLMQSFLARMQQNINHASGKETL